MIERIVSFEPEFKAVLFLNPKRLRQRSVPDVDSRIIDDSLAGVSPRSEGGLHETSGVEPLEPILRRLVGVTPGDPIGVLVAISRSAVIQVSDCLWDSR